MGIRRLATQSLLLVGFGLAVFLVLVGCGGSESNSGGSGGAGGADTGCEHDGQHYDDGESVPSGDRCNTCSCYDGQVACTAAWCPSYCVEGDESYHVGQTWDAGDDCNTCTCRDDGSIDCSELDCVPPCTYAGVEYQEGDSFDALDGCNTCTCTQGAASCTELACPCDPAVEWWRKYTFVNPEECLVSNHDCPANTVRFDNVCGCGCEQDASCPPTIDCMPPTDCSDLQAKCPFSEVAY